MKDSRSEHKSQNLNARLLRFRAQPESEDVYDLAEALISAQRYADARGVISAAQPKSGEDGALLVLEGRAWLLERDLVRAQAVLLRAVRAAPDLQPAYRWLGEVLLKRGDPQRAAKTLHRALTLDPDDAEAAKLAARAEYLAEAANDGLEPVAPDADSSFDSEPAERRVSNTPAATSGNGQRPVPSARAAQPPARPPPAAAGSRLSMPQPSPSSRSRSLREPSGDDGRIEPPTMPLSQAGRELPRPYIAAPSDATRRARGGTRNPPTEPIEPTSEYRRVGGPAEELGVGRSPSRDGSARSLPSPSDGATRTASGGQPSPFASRPAREAVRSEPQVKLPPLRSPPPTAAGKRFEPAKPSLPALRSAGSQRAPTSSLPPLTRSDGAAARPSPQPSAAGTKPLTRSGPAAQRTFDKPARRQPAQELQNPSVRFEEESSPALEIPTGVATLESEPPPPAAAAPRPTARDAVMQASRELRAEAAARDQARAVAGPVDAEAMLALVQRLGLFEAGAAAPARWSIRAELEPRGQRLRNALIVVWAVTLVLCVGGYFGWNEFVARRHARAAQLVAQARALTLHGDHGALVDAERLLRLAREQHPASQDPPREALLLQAQRVLDDGERDMAALRSAFARARAFKVEGPVVALGSALLSAASGEASARDRGLAEVLATAQADARLIYLVGRAEQRAGRPEAITHLQAAAQADAKLAPAQLALAELAFDQGDREAAQRAVNAALSADPEQLRARLFRMFLSADDADPSSVQRELTQLGDAMKKAGNIDLALAALVRARVLRRQAQNDAAASAVEAAGTAGADEPRLLSWVAREALVLGKLTLAQHLASQALSAAPDVAQNRRLLARILIDRNDGEHALVLLEKLPADDLEAQIMKAQAALLSSDPNALKAALEGLAQVPTTRRELATTTGALRVRIEARLTPGKAVVDRARALVRAAPGDPEALFALAEAALAAHDPATAQNALKQRFAVAPDDPNAHCMLGRAKRMAVDAAGAEASFRRALELAPGHGEAMIALAALLLDEGKFAEADGVFQELATRGGSALLGRLGRVDALTALGRYDDAAVQLAAIPEAQANNAGYRLSAARLALARAKPGDALGLLRPLVDEQGDKVQVMTLYGDALSAAQQLEAAAGAYDAALAIDPELPEALLGRAEVWLQTAKANDALALLQKAKDALPQRIRPPALQARRLALLGRAYLARGKRGDVESGRDALREAAKLEGAPADTFYFLAEALGGKGNAEARTAYQRYLELDPHGRYRDRVRRALGSSQ